MKSEVIDAGFGAYGHDERLSFHVKLRLIDGDNLLVVRPGARRTSSCGEDSLVKVDDLLSAFLASAYQLIY